MAGTKTQWNVKDFDAAMALATRLESVGNEIGEVSQSMRQQAESIREIDGTMEMNVQIANYLSEAANVMASTIDGIQNAAKQLSAIVSSAEQMAEHANKGSLFHG